MGSRASTLLRDEEIEEIKKETGCIFKLTDSSDLDCGCTVNIWTRVAEGMTKWTVGVETIALGWDGQELLKPTLSLKPMYHLNCSIG
ncbi:hypothetical protein llap_14133 [Limosa lapponica baueri]|uniref:Uncharacterized protein n=1 Tax=Limosa lapponica baueri TaxID=1758121 RepID=A0A2I0TPA9_LIMLA|nr:hypothetical protein llap_14133 [Limosa lapponica baueri]